MTRRAGHVAALALTWACSAAGAREGDPLAVQWSGCDAVVAGGCAVQSTGTATIVAWVDDADPALRIVDDRGGSHGPNALVDGGRQFRVPIAEDVSSLRMLDADGRSRWTLPIVRREPIPSDAEAPATIEEVEARPGPQRAQALRDGFSAAHAAGDATAAQRFAIASHVVALASGEWSTACGVAQAAAFSAKHLGGDSARADAWLDLTRWCDAVVPESAPGAIYSRGMIMANDGRRIEALELLHRAWRGAARLDRDEAHSFALYYAGVLGEAGFTLAAERMFEGLVAEVAPGCTHAMLVLNFAWLLQLRGEAEGSTALLHRSGSLLEQGLAELDGAGSCADELPLLAETFHINLAHGALLLGDPARARRELDAIDPSHLDPGLARWFRRLDAAVALAQGRPERATAWLAEVTQSSDDDGDHDAVWRDRVLAARLADALGDTEASRAHDLAAERALDGMVASFAQGIAAGPLLGAHPESSARLVARALEIGDRRDAWCTMRRARRRPLLATAAATWRMHDPAVAARLREHRERLADIARDIPGVDRESQRIRSERRGALARAFAVELANGLDRDTTQESAQDDCGPRPPDGTLVLAFHPATRGGWTVFAALDGAIETTWIPGTPTDYDAHELSARVLTPFTALVERSSRIRVLPAGPWNAVDVHALPWGADALLVARSVTYALDLPVPAAPSGAAVTVSFVDADPLRTLADLRAPMLAVQRRLAASLPTAWSEPASVDALLGSLAGVDAWIYFGHAAPPRDADAVPWQSSIGLLLPAEQRLDAFDLLSAPSGAPRQVALLGCGTGTVDPSLPPGSITLPQALVIRGARSVLATGDDVTPALAVAVAERLADTASAGAEAIDLRAALRVAQLELRQQDRAAAWATFRVWEP